MHFVVRFFQLKAVLFQDLKCFKWFVHTKKLGKNIISQICEQVAAIEEVRPYTAYKSPLNDLMMVEYNCQVELPIAKSTSISDVVLNKCRKKI